MSSEYRISFFISLLGFFTTVFNILRAVTSNMTLLEIVLHPSISLILFVSIILLLLVLKRNQITLNINRVFQVLIFTVIGTIGILQKFSSSYGIGLLILAIVLLAKYRFFDRYREVKVIAIFIYILCLVEFSVLRFNDYNITGYGIEVLIFMLFFFGITFLAYSDELSISKRKLQRLQSAKDEADKRIHKEVERIKKLEKQIHKIEEEKKKKTGKFDLKARGVTRAEEKVLETLVVYNYRNAQIAERLGKSEQTVKVQMRSLLDKIGAEDRHQLRDLCRNNFSKSDSNY